MLSKHALLLNVVMLNVCTAAASEAPRASADVDAAASDVSEVPHASAASIIHTALATFLMTHIGLSSVKARFSSGISCSIPRLIRNRVTLTYSPPLARLRRSVVFCQLRSG